MASVDISCHIYALIIVVLSRNVGTIDSRSERYICVPHFIFITVVYFFLVSMNDWSQITPGFLSLCILRSSDKTSLFILHVSTYFSVPHVFISYFTMGFIWVLCWEWCMTGAVLTTISMRGQHLTAFVQTEISQPLLHGLLWNLVHISGWCPEDES